MNLKWKTLTPNQSSRHTKKNEKKWNKTKPATLEEAYVSYSIELFVQLVNEAWTVHTQQPLAAFRAVFSLALSHSLNSIHSVRFDRTIRSNIHKFYRLATKSDNICAAISIIFPSSQLTVRLNCLFRIYVGLVVDLIRFHVKIGCRSHPDNKTICWLRVPEILRSEF